MPGIPRFDAAATAQDVAAALREHGCAVIERLASPAACSAVVRELEPWVDATPTGSDAFSGVNTRRTGALLARSDAAVDFIAHPTVLGVVDEVLWQRKTAYQLHLTQVITIGPGSDAQQLHRDHWCFDFFPFPPEVDIEVSTMWALTDFTADNGATRVVVDSHRTTGMPYAMDDTVAATMPLGSVLLYTGGTVHAGGANVSSDVRQGLNVDYVLGFLRQEENQYLWVPLERVRELPEPVQRLMGYSYGAFALGYVDDVRDPMTVVRPDADRSSSFAPR